MQLKSLEIQGFKTFPDKTVLTFGDGITAVVGPNGSGKSNISDAIRWVLGEQSNKTLRCSKMEDVIFSGTPIRKALGFAEATLTIDNSDRKLPFDGDTLAVTRRFYRSGDSEYLINKAAVRLKDIHELFMDTGLGRDGYSIIGQGKIDSIVASRSEDRREIFEEAAGISRFRYRKGEAERRLAQTEENLLRLRDILAELESRVGPLEQQAQKAKQYLTLAQEKRSLEIGLWLRTLEQSGRLLREQEDKIATAQAQHDGIEQVLEQSRRESEEIFARMNSHTARVDAVRREAAALDEEATGKLGQASVLENDILHNNETIQRLQGEMEAARRSSREMDEEIQSKKEEIGSLEQTLAAKQQEIDHCQQEMDYLRGEMGKFEGASGKISDELAGVSLRLSDAKVAQVTAQSSIQEIEARQQAVTQKVAQSSQREQELTQSLQDYRQMLQEAQQQADSLRNTQKGYEMRLNTRRQKREELKAKADKLSLDAEECIRRARLLEELERNLEGFTHSVKLVMKEYRRGGLSGIHGPVSRLFEVESRYAVALETALGSAMQNIVVDTEENAKQAIGFLKRRDGGRATFLPLSTIRGNVLNEPGLEDCFGFVGVASELCHYQPRYEGVIHSLLGRIAVAEDLDSAVAIARRFRYRFRVVTLDGQVVNAGGSLTGGSLNRNAGLLSRASEIEAVKKQAEQLKDKALAARNELRQAEAEASAAEAALSGARGELASAQEDCIRLDAGCKNAESELASLCRELEALRREEEELAGRKEQLQKTVQEKQQEQEELSSQVAQLEEQMRTLTGGRENLVDRREELLEHLQQLRLAAVGTEKDIAAHEAEIANIISRQSDQGQRVKAYQEEKQKVAARNEELQIQIDALRERAEQLKQQAAQERARIEELTRERMELEQRTVQLREAEREKTGELERIGRELARLEERKVGLQKEYDGIISRLWEEYELTRREAEEVGEKIEDLPAARKKLNELKLKIKALGTVNVSAIEEYQEVSARYAFMKGQVDDVERSRSELNKLIGDLTQQMRELFLSRFQQINANFGETFRELFGGGRAGLRLSAPDDILNSGIEIDVQPPGKIVTHLELLSGGEKALVAIALYFAIMKVNPAPFCVLDEIEAALDDVNVDRFAAYLRRMNSNTQFIVITHRRGTMEEADVLYGVTMQDEGISKLLELHAAELARRLQIE